MKKSNKLFLFLFLLAPCLSGCKNEVTYLTPDFELSLRETRPTCSYSLTTPIDIESYVYCSDYTLGKCTVKVNGVTSDIKGHIYFPNEKGEHIFTYTAKEKSVSFSVMVSADSISISYKDYPFVTSVNKTISFKKLEQNMSLNIAPDDVTYSLLGVEYRPVIVDEFDNYVEQNWTSFTYTTKNFTTSNAGEYRVNYQAENDKETKTFSLNVVAVDVSKGDSKIYLDSYNTYASIGSFYKVDGEEITAHIAKSADYSTANYIGLDEILNLSQGISITWKGKNLPQIGMYVSPDDESAYPFGLYSSKGYLLSFENSYSDRYKLWGSDMLSGFAPKEGNPVRNELFGWDDLEDDKYYKLNVMLSEVKASSGYGRSINFDLIEIENYGKKDEIKYSILSITTGAGNWVDEKNVTSGRFALYSSRYKDIDFKISTFKKMPEEDVYPEKVKDNVFIKNGTYNLLSDSYNLKQVTYSNLKDGNDIITGRASVSSFVALKGDYGQGTEISFSFHGRNIPNVCLFADSFVGKKGEIIGSGTGLQFLMAGRSTFGSEWLGQRINAYGPHRLETGVASDYQGYSGALGYLDRIGKYYDGTTEIKDDQRNLFKIGYEKLNVDLDYIYTIKIVKADSSGYEILHILETDEALVQTIKYTLGPTQDLLTSGNIIIYGSLVQDENGTRLPDTSITFSYQLKEAK